MLGLLDSILMLDDSVMVRAARRFAEAFAAAWQRVPRDAQQVISDYFRRCPGRVYMRFRMDLGDYPNEPWGRCSWHADKTILTFLAPFCEGVEPLEALVSVIAHELAHCFTKGNETWTENEEQEERNARKITKHWGFEEPAVGDRAAWIEEIERWRRVHAVEFGACTERLLLQP